MLFPAKLQQVFSTFSEVSFTVIAFSESLGYHSVSCLSPEANL